MTNLFLFISFFASFTKRQILGCQSYMFRTTLEQNLSIYFVVVLVIIVHDTEVFTLLYNPLHLGVAT